MAGYLETSSSKPQHSSPETPCIIVGNLRQEVEKTFAPKVSPELLDFIEFLLVIGHRKRQTAVEVLQHPYLDDVLHLEAPSTG